MSATRWRAGVGGLAATALCIALTACGPADNGAAGLPSPAAGSVSDTAGGTGSVNPQSTASARTTAAAPPLRTSATPSAAVKPTESTKPTPTPTAKPTAAKPSPAAPTVTASLGDGPIRYGDHSAITITVRTPTPGADLTGHVAVLDGTAVVVEGETDAAGNAALDFLNTADPGSRTYQVSYGGNAKVAPSTVDLPVQITRTNVDITIDWPEDVTPGRDATITADIIGTPQAPTGKATITVDGAPLTAASVDANGTITGTAKAVAAGDHAVEVSYAGDARFDPNTASATLTLKAPPVNPNQAGAAAAQANNPCPAAAAACVDLSGETAWLQSAGKITYGPVPITSGREGHRTGTGMFSVFWLDKDHRSSIFNDAPMPNSVFFDNGIAFHEGSLSDQSHGCIHLSWDASETFFDTLSVGDNVYVWGAPPY